MFTGRIFSWPVIVLLAMAGLLVGLGSPLLAQQGAPTDDYNLPKGLEVQARGPIHEAFAEVVNFNPEPGIIAKKPVPPAIEELPPDHFHAHGFRKDAYLGANIPISYDPQCFTSQLIASLRLF